MSRGKSPKLNLKLNLSMATRGNPSRTTGNYEGEGSQGGSPASLSPPSSCVSSEGEMGVRCSKSPEATSMVLAACPRCLMYVMLSEDDPKCPKCKSNVLLDFLQDGANKKKNRNS
ncbi:hypothetical protein HPP92_009785 [Vanilla planifolia]|uniref:GIR1-like zinc ribbon domain-containing protein n=1 Tax=Vanilla planifolia TaxID=51239 RepID=A0A835R4W2_VANPL|nr:hypothetical protein HPP92_009785 [Vanilla planifolia]